MSGIRKFHIHCKPDTSFLATQRTRRTSLSISISRWHTVLAGIRGKTQRLLWNKERAEDVNRAVRKRRKIFQRSSFYILVTERAISKRSFSTCLQKWRHVRGILFLPT